MRDDLARRRYSRDAGTPETKETLSEKALVGQDANASNGKCRYCDRPNHVLRDCYVLQRDLLSANVKEGTVLPANFAVKPSRRSGASMRQPQNEKTRHQRSGDKPRTVRHYRDDDRKRHDHRPKKGSRRDSRSDSAASNSDYDSDWHHRTRDSNRGYTAKPRTEYAAVAQVVPPNYGLVMPSTTPNSTNEWIVDSGFSSHVCTDTQWFTNLSSHDGDIVVGGKSNVKIEGIGTVVLDVKGKTLKLRKVLYAPSMAFNLLSISKAVSADALEVRFTDSGRCLIQRADASRVLSADLDAATGLYQFMAEPMRAIALVGRKSKKQVSVLWHNRLGHPNSRALLKLLADHGTRQD